MDYFGFWKSSSEMSTFFIDVLQQDEFEFMKHKFRGVCYDSYGLADIVGIIWEHGILFSKSYRCTAIEMGGSDNPIIYNSYKNDSSYYGEYLVDGVIVDIDDEGFEVKNPAKWTGPFYLQDMNKPSR
ncbi:MAG: hypothetical protein KKA51_06430 [Nanoarchaeota archaeon]|nr:hypothetical protein [Nanoarchaeota archaeon]